jgi:hypothetical protein
MEREIWEILEALGNNKLSAIEAHKKLCGLYSASAMCLLNQCLNEQEEIINSPIRFNGVHVNRIKEVFLKNGIEDEPSF